MPDPMRFQKADNIERDLMAARTGERKTYSPDIVNVSDRCRNCDVGLSGHVRESGILFCSDEALRVIWGK